MKKLAGVVTVLALVGFAAQLAAQECGHCEEMPRPFPPYDDVHQMTDDSPDYIGCSGGPFHYVHDCENGDGSTWVTGDCYEDHVEELCSEVPLLAARLRSSHLQPVSPGYAIALAMLYPRNVSYIREAGLVTVRNCKGGARITGLVTRPGATPAAASGAAFPLIVRGQ